MFRYLAPAGSPIGLTDLVQWTATGLSGADAVASLQAAIRDRFDVRHCTLTSTGRAGMTVALRAMHRLAGGDRHEVVLPSYTCYSLAGSVMKAGLRPRIVDIDPATLDYRRDALQAVDTTRVLALVATNLYGIPNDLPWLQAFARERRISLVDDAAQAMGARVGGRWSGTWGDVGLFSLDKGKNVSAIDGGILVTNDSDLAHAIEARVAGSAAVPIAATLGHVAKAVAYSLLLRPWLYGVPARIPQLELGKTVYTTEYPLAVADPALAALAGVMLRKLDAFTTARVANAKALLAALSASPGITRIAVPPDASAVYLRLPLLMPDAATRARVIAALTAQGIGATASYPGSLVDIDALRDHIDVSVCADGGREVAARILTLPTHPFVTATDIARMAAVVSEAIGGGQRGRHTGTEARPSTACVDEADGVARQGFSGSAR